MKSKKAKPNPVCCSLYAILAGCLLIVAAGCENAAGPTPAEQIVALRQEKTLLAQQLEQARVESEQLQGQVKTLSGLPGDKLENLYDLQEVKLTKYTGFYDKNKDGIKEKLIVYIQPIDRQGDIVKATGAVDVQLWDLNREDGEALLGQWRVGPDELKELWFATILIINYRLTFDVTGVIDGTKESLTVKVTFTDYLSGKVFKEQKVIKPN